MKNTFKLLSLIIAYSLMHAEGLLSPPSGDLADGSNVEIGGAITNINSLNESGAININKSSSIKLLENKNTQDIMIKSPFDVNSTFTTDSRNSNTNKLYFSRQITVNAGGNYIDYGSKFIGEGGKFFDGRNLSTQDNNPAIKINGGKVTLYGSYLESGQMEPGGGFKNAPTIFLTKGTLDIVGSTLIGHKQGTSYIKALDVPASATDSVSVNITGSTFIVSNTSSSITSKRDITIDDTLWDSKWSGIKKAPKKQGSHIVGGISVNTENQTVVIVPQSKLTIRGILKDTASGFDAKTSSNLITSYKDPMTSNHTPFDTFIYGSNSIDGVVDIDTTYILGEINFNEQADKSGRSLSIKNTFITGMIQGSYGATSTASKITSNFTFDNVLAGGLIINNYGDISSINSYFAKNVKAIKNGASIIKDNGSVFMGGVSANNMDFTNSELKGGDYGVANGATTDKATKISLSNVKAYDKANIFTNELILNSSIINSSLNTNSITSTNSNINTKLGSNLSSVNLSGGSVMGGFKTQNLNASNTVFFLGGTKATYDGMIISTNQTLGSNNTLGILGVATKDSSGKLITNAINNNLPLAVLRGGNDFFKQAKFYHGITELAPANANLVYEKVKDKNGYEYLAYVLVKDSDKNKGLKDMVFDGGNFSVESAINGSLVSANGSLINENIIKELSGKNGSVSFTPDDIGNLTPPNITPPPSGGGDGSSGSGENNGSNGGGGTTTPPDNGNNGSNGETTTPPDLTPPAKPSIKEELELMITGQNEEALNEAKVMANQFYYSHIFEYNNLNKRMGELRRLNGRNGGIWSRGYFTRASIYDTKLDSSAMQIGADKLSDTDFGYLYAGFLLNIGKTKSNTNSSIDNYGGGFYASFIGCNGVFTDFTIKLNHYKSHFKNDTFLGELESSGTGYIASFEIGNRFGNEYYLEPSVEFIASYTPKTDINNQNISIKSKENLMQVLKTSLNGGARFDKFDLRFGIGGVFDLNKPSEFVIDDGLSSYVFDREKKDKRGFATFGLNANLSKNTMFSIEFEKGFGGIMKLDYDASATIRYEF